MQQVQGHPECVPGRVENGSLIQFGRRGLNPRRLFEPLTKKAEEKIARGLECFCVSKSSFLASSSSSICGVYLPNWWRHVPPPTTSFFHREEQQSKREKKSLF